MSSVPVTWTRDDAKRRIEVVIRLDIYVKAPDGQPAEKKYVTMMQSLMRRALRDAERRWKGKYKCYDFVVTIQDRYVESLADVAPDALDVEIDDSLMLYGVTRAKSPHDTERATLSDDPVDSVVPVRSTPDDDDPHTAWPPSSSTVTHEIGHVIGLDEGYHKSGWFGLWGDLETIPGHREDVMAKPTNPVMPATIEQAVRRHFGPQIDDTLHCPIGLRTGPADFDLLIASITDIRLQARAERYDPPTGDPDAPGEPATFTGTFHAAGEYLTRMGIPGLSASGTIDTPVSFTLDTRREPMALSIDLGFWVLTQTLRWDAGSGLPYAEGPLVINADGGSLDSALLWPGPPLALEFFDPDEEPAA